MENDEIDFEELYERVKARNNLSFGELDLTSDGYLLESKNPILILYIPSLIGEGNFVRAHLMTDIFGKESLEEILQSLGELIIYRDKLRKLGYNGRFEHDDENFEYFYEIEVRDTSILKKIVVDFGSLRSVNSYRYSKEKLI